MATPDVQRIGFAPGHVEETMRRVELYRDVAKLALDLQDFDTAETLTKRAGQILIALDTPMLLMKDQHATADE